MFNHTHRHGRRQHTVLDGTVTVAPTPVTARGQQADVDDPPTRIASDAPSFRLAPRPSDLPGGFWAAHASRCRQRLADELEWAGPLLDPHAPNPVACTRPQARHLFVWNDQLPTTAQLSFTCEHLAG